MSSPLLPDVVVAQPPGSPNMIYDLEHSVQQVEKSVLEELKQRILLTNRVDGLANRLSEVEKSVAEEQKQRTLLTSRVDMLDTRLSEVQTVLRQVSALLALALPQANAGTSSDAVLVRSAS